MQRVFNGCFYPPPDAGVFLYSSSGQNQALDGSFRPSIQAVGGQISPNGELLLSTYRGETVVFNRSGQLIYRGASGGSYSTSHWLGNNRVLRLNYTFTERDPRLRSYYDISYYIIDPLTRTYEIFVPLTDSWGEDSFFYEDDRPIELGHPVATLTYDGRYLLTRGGRAFDFVNQEEVELENARIGIPSMTSYRFLVVEYNSFDHSAVNDEQVHPIQVYDLDTDTLQQVATIIADRLMDVYEDSWSPDERYWAYGLNFFREAAFPRINIFDLTTGENTPTCLGRYYETSGTGEEYTLQISGVDRPFFAWSRDSRYLALQGVLEGEDMDESLGVYIYDTQTGDIYQVYQGRAGIVGWMASPNTE